MAVYVAFLRGINVGGNNKIPMAELREMFADLGFKGAMTLLQSGNVVFESAKKPIGALEKLLEAETTKRFAVTIDYMVITSAELAEAIKGNPFTKEARDDPSHVLVLFLKQEATKDAERSLAEGIKGPEIIKVNGRVAYAIFPAGIGTSKVTPTFIDKRLGTRSTARNWNTVSKLLSMTLGEDKK